MKRLRVRAGNRSYNVVVGRGAWSALQTLDRSAYTSVFVLTERGLWKAWGKRFDRATGWKNCRTLFVPAG